MADYTLVLCLAGLGSRFTTAGYTTPKFLLPMADGTTSIVQEILTAFQGTTNAQGLLLINQRNLPWKDKIDTALAAVPYPIEVEYVNDTQGQAETAHLGTAILAAKYPQLMQSPIFFHNGDTVLYHRNLADYASQIEGAAGIIDTFEMDSPAYSYITTDAAGKVLDMKEKVVISNQATTGLYGFSSPALYQHYYTQAKGTWQKEFYISDVYKTMLAAGATLRGVHHADATHTLNLGTPAEYEAYLSAVRRQAI